MNTPKLLPWVARKAGISEARAEELWIDAVCETTAESEWVGTSEYWGNAVDRWLALVDAEAALAVKPRVTSILGYQQRMAVLPIEAAEQVAHAWASLLDSCQKPSQNSLWWQAQGNAWWPTQQSANWWQGPRRAA